MTTLLEGARSFATRGTDLGPRIDGLDQAAGAARGRLDDDLVDEVEAVSARAAGRVRLSARHTVVAIAGATGSGKSTTFNALSGLELSSTGVRRPTTSWATACVWGNEGASELLEWLGIPPRHQTMRDSMLDSGLDDHALDGVVLLDLPDHDSTEVAHHLEVDRLVELADLLVWVLDPQKYADAAIHDRYLAPLAGYAGVMLVVLNHIDSVPEDRRQSMIDDLRRLLAADGLADVHLVPISAREGIGVDRLRAEIADRAAAKREARERLSTDLRTAGDRLAEAGGQGRPRELQPRRVRDCEQALAEAAGVPTIAVAVERVAQRRLGRATGWPPAVAVSAVARRRDSALPESLRADLGSPGRDGPRAVTVQRSLVDAELRATADDSSTGLDEPWTEAVRRAALEGREQAGDRIDAALAQADLRVDRLPLWAHLVRALQWILLLTAVGGGAWYGYLAATDELTASTTPQLLDQPVALWLGLGGLLLGLLLTAVTRGVVGRAAKDRATATRTTLRAEINDLTAELVAAPIAAELARHARFHAGVAAARH